MCDFICGSEHSIHSGVFGSTSCAIVIVQDGNCSVAGKWNCMLGCLTHGGQLEIKIFLYSFVQFSWFQFCFLFLRVGFPLFDPC
jgi:hypothetical protein